MALTTTYLPSFTPVNDAERIAAIASSNLNSIAVDGAILHSFRGATTLGQQPNVATPIATSVAPVAAGLASSLTSTSNFWVSCDWPRAIIPAGNAQDDGGNATSGTAIMGTTGSTWQPIGLANLGNLTAF